MRAALLPLGLAVMLLVAAPPSTAMRGAGAGSVSAQAPPPADPSQPGPYEVGVTRRTITRPSSTTGEPRALDTVIWYPAYVVSRAPDASLGATVDAPPVQEGGPYPVVVWSHGSGGVPWESTFFTAHLASHGFVVAAPTHKGNTIDCPFPCLPSNSVARPAIVDASANRPDDVSFALDQALGLSAGDDGLLAGLLDAERPGVGGWSFGGGTALRVIASDPRFRAAVAFAPYADESTLEAVRRIARPTMLWGGILDDVLPIAQQRELHGRFPPTGPEHWLMTFPRAGHSAFANRCLPTLAGCGPGDLPQAQAHALIRRWGTAFLRRHVALDDRYAPLLDPALAEGDPDIRIAFTPAP